MPVSEFSVGFKEYAVWSRKLILFFYIRELNYFFISCLSILSWWSVYQEMFFSLQTDKLSKLEKVKDDMTKIDRANFELLAHEEIQFQEYASKVIEHCEEGGRNVYPLKKAAVAGVGGGAGPVFHEKGGIRPSYMVNDKSGKQMPHYQKESTNNIKETINGKAQTKKRLGFVWWSAFKSKTVILKLYSLLHLIKPSILSMYILHYKVD